MNRLEGRVAIVTGGGRGIGASVAAAFAAEGAHLVVNDLGGASDGTGNDAGPVQDTVNSIVAGGGTAVADHGDIADVTTGERLVATAIEQFGRLDVVVNAAGILRDRMIFNLSEQDWDQVIRVHLKGHYSTLRPAAAYWRAQRRPDGHYRAINFSSLSGLEGSPGQPNYAAAKMGIVGLTYSLAQGLARYGVTVNAIAPAAATRLTAAIPEDKQVGADLSDAAASQLMSTESITPLLVYLAGQRSDWLTGRVLFAMGHEVGLYRNPQLIRHITSTGPWQPDQLATTIEQSFRPVADGLPASVFGAQL